MHGGGLQSVHADGQESLPVGVLRGRARAVVVQARGGDGDGFDDGGGRNVGVIHGGGGGDDGNGLDGIGADGPGGGGLGGVDFG